MVPKVLLPAARFAHQAQGFAFPDLQAHAVHCLEEFVSPYLEMLLKIFDL